LGFWLAHNCLEVQQALITDLSISLLILKIHQRGYCNGPNMQLGFVSPLTYGPNSVCESLEEPDSPRGLASTRSSLTPPARPTLSQHDGLPYL